MFAALPNTALYLIATLIWGSTWLAITWQLGEVPPAVSVGWRFLMAGCVLLAWSRLRGESLRLPWREYGWCLWQGILLFGVSYVCVYEAERWIASGLMAVLNSSMLLFNLIGMRLAFDKRIDAQSAIGAALGTAGIALVFWPEVLADHATGSWRGVAYGLAAALIASCGNLVAQRNRQAAQPLLPGTGCAMVLGGASALVLALLTGQPLGFDFRAPYVLSLLYLSLFGSVLAFLAYFTLIGRIGAGRAGYMAVAVPILALIMSGLFEGLRWTGWTVAGIACAVLGNVVMLRRPQTGA
ncbi:DMT family transporter [Viridibacterium curvum]|uniref:EamA family transporter n=1 Tax=Viridibacterium curvum TaxID=1101404 RepID=A0ABP9QJA4_9RHOO